jgi:hypothetical protein
MVQGAKIKLAQQFSLLVHMELHLSCESNQQKGFELAEFLMLELQE